MKKFMAVLSFLLMLTLLLAPITATLAEAWGTGSSGGGAGAPGGGAGAYASNRPLRDPNSAHRAWIASDERPGDRAARHGSCRPVDVAVRSGLDEPALGDEATAIADAPAVVQDRRVADVFRVDVGGLRVDGIGRDHRARDAPATRTVRFDVLLGLDQRVQRRVAG